LSIIAAPRRVIFSLGLAKKVGKKLVAKRYRVINLEKFTINCVLKRLFLDYRLQITDFKFCFDVFGCLACIVFL
jgi:hypothetical protein